MVGGRACGGREEDVGTELGAELTRLGWSIACNLAGNLASELTRLGSSIAISELARPRLTAAIPPALVRTMSS